MLYTLLKTLNFQMQGILQNPMLKMEQQLLKLRTLIQSHTMIENKMRLAALNALKNNRAVGPGAGQGLAIQQ